MGGLLSSSPGISSSPALRLPVPARAPGAQPYLGARSVLRWSGDMMRDGVSRLGCGRSFFGGCQNGFWQQDHCRSRPRFIGVRARRRVQANASGRGRSVPPLARFASPRSSPWNGSWNGGLSNPSSTGASGAITRAISAASGCGAPGRTSCNQPVRHERPLRLIISKRRFVGASLALRPCEDFLHDHQGRTFGAPGLTA